MNIGFWLQLLLNGLVLASIYALISVGLSMIFGVLEIVNFAHGEFYMLGAVVSYFLFPIGGYVGGILLTMIIMGAFGALLYRFLFKQIEGKQNIERSILLTIGLSMLLQNGTLKLFGSSSRITSPAMTEGSWRLFGAVMPINRVLVVIAAVITLTVLLLLLQKTPLGQAMRGVPQNRLAATMVGISPHKVAIVTVAIGAALAGVAGGALAPVYAVSPMMGVLIVFKAFAIVIIGGMGSLKGAIYASLGIGVVESFVGGLANPVLQNSAAFVLMVLILFIRPEGVFGKTVRV